MNDSRKILVYMLGPPVDFDGDESGLLEWVISHLQSFPGQLYVFSFRVQVVGQTIPVFSTPEHSSIRDGMAGLELKLVECSWYGGAMRSDNFTIIVKDGSFLQLSQRAGETPAF